MLVKQPPAVQYLVKNYALAGVEIAGFDESGSWVSLTLPVDFEDLTDLLIELKDEFRLEADYRYCSDSKTATLLLTEVEIDTDDAVRTEAPSIGTTPILVVASIASAAMAIAALVLARVEVPMVNTTF